MPAELMGDLGSLCILVASSLEPVPLTGDLGAPAELTGDLGISLDRPWNLPGAPWGNAHANLCVVFPPHSGLIRPVCDCENIGKQRMGTTQTKKNKRNEQAKCEELTRALSVPLGQRNQRYPGRTLGNSYLSTYLRHS